MILLNNLLKIHTSSAPSERVFSRAKADSTAPEIEPSLSTFGGVCHAKAQCMVNYKYLDKQARCLHHCMFCISDSVSVSVICKL